MKKPNQLISKRGTFLAGATSIAVIAVLVATGAVLQGQVGVPAVQSTSPDSTSQTTSSASADATVGASLASLSTSSYLLTTSTVPPSSSTTTSSSDVTLCDPGASGPITTAFSSPDDTAYTNFVPLFSSYHDMNVSFYELSTGTGTFTETYTTTTDSVQGTIAFNEAYAATDLGAAGYRVAVGYDQSGTSQVTVAWVLGNGTVTVLDYLGNNVTGDEAASLFQGIMYPFTFEADYGLVVSALTTASGVRSTSTATTSLGGADGAVASLTSYSAVSYPISAQVCATTLDMTGLSLEVAAVHGQQTPLIVALHITGAATYQGQTNQILSLSLNLTSLQRAP